MKHILLVGGSTGIGKALAEELLQKGYKVTMASRNRPDIDHSHFNHLSFDVLTSDASDLLIRAERLLWARLASIQTAGRPSS